jgi:hypothetical protein
MTRAVLAESNDYVLEHEYETVCSGQVFSDTTISSFSAIMRS